METNQILSLIAEAIDVDVASINLDTELDSIEEYDSMAKLGLIVMADDEFSLKLSGEQIRQFVKISDIVSFLSK